jgi:hypothetical protein
VDFGCDVNFAAFADAETRRGPFADTVDSQKSRLLKR